MMASLTQYIAAMTQDEKDHFKVLGARATLFVDGFRAGADRARGRCGLAPVRARLRESISAPPKTQQDVVMQMMETVLAQQGRRATTRGMQRQQSKFN